MIKSSTYIPTISIISILGLMRRKTQESTVHRWRPTSKRFPINNWLYTGGNWRTPCTAFFRRTAVPYQISVYTPWQDKKYLSINTRLNKCLFNVPVIKSPIALQAGGRDHPYEGRHRCWTKRVKVIKALALHVPTGHETCLPSGNFTQAIRLS